MEPLLILHKVVQMPKHEKKSVIRMFYESLHQQFTIDLHNALLNTFLKRVKTTYSNFCG